PNEPLYPFGHGIGYTTFAYGVPQLSAVQLGWDEIPNEPLYPFGHGIGYTTFAYGVPQLSAVQLGWD
ncbi:hypothetical protein C7E12_23635, partial [Stenotrophomonas maltophilia]